MSEKLKRTIQEWTARRGYTLITLLSGEKPTAVQFRCAYGHLFERPIEFFESGYALLNQKTNCSHCMESKVRQEGQALIPVLEAYAIKHDLQFIGFEPGQQINVRFQCKQGHVFCDLAQRVLSSKLACPECAAQLHAQKKIESAINKRLKQIQTFEAGLIKKGYIKVHQNAEPNDEQNFLIRCAQGHEQWMDYTKTPVCSCCKQRDFQANIDAVIEIISTAGLKLIGQITNLRERVVVECKNGHQFSHKGHYFSHNSVKCQKCVDVEEARLRSESITPKAAVLLARLEKMLAAKRYTLIGARPQHTKSSVSIQCDKGHSYSRPLYKIKLQSHTCPSCKYSPEDLLAALERRGFKLSSPWVNQAKTLQLVCENGHPFSAHVFGIISNLIPCPVCKKDSNIERINTLIERLQNIAHAENMELVSRDEVLNHHSGVTLKCEKGHISNRKIYQMIAGYCFCPTCRYKKK